MQILHPFAGSIQQYLETISDPDRYRPEHCPQCQAKEPLVGHGFYRRTLTPLPKGGDAEGWLQGRLPGGHLTWLAVFRVRKIAPATRTPSYLQVLEVKYTPIPGLFLRAVRPCLDNEFAACRRTDGAVRVALAQLLSALRRSSVPPAVAKGDRELRRGLSALERAVTVRIRLAHPATVGPFEDADQQIIAALDLSDQAAHDLNTEDPDLHLRPI